MLHELEFGNLAVRRHV